MKEVTDQQLINELRYLINKQLAKFDDPLILNQYKAGLRYHISVSKDGALHSWFEKDDSHVPTWTPFASSKTE